MASSNDSAFVEDADVDQQLQERPHSRDNGSPSRPYRIHETPNKSGTSSPGVEAGEQVPLLSDAGSSYDGTREPERHSENDEPEWFGHAELRGLPWWKRPSIYWLLPPFCLFTLAFGAIIVPKLNLIMDLVCDEYYASQSPDPISGPMDPGQQPDRCQNDAVSSRSSLFLLYGNLCGGTLSAITSPKLGALSDRYGRKKLLLLTTSGALMGELLTILAAKFPETVHVNWILVGFALDGLTGSFIVGMAISHSYATDCTSPQKRNVAFGYFHAALFSGIALGPVMAGYIIKAREKYVAKTDAVLLVFYIALAFHITFMLFVAFARDRS